MLLNQWWRMKNLKNQQPMHGTSLYCLSLNLHPSSFFPLGPRCCSSPIVAWSYLCFYSCMHSMNAIPCGSRYIWYSPCSSYPCACNDSNPHQEIWVCLASSCLVALNPLISSFLWIDLKPLEKDIVLCWIWWCPSSLAYLALESVTPWSYLVMEFSRF